MAHPREYAPSLDSATAQPLFLQIARALTRDIRAGRLQPGARLPGTRELSRRVGVHRNTVLVAYAELEQQGWITTSPARGSFVTDALPEKPARHVARPEPSRRCAIELPPLFGAAPTEQPANSFALLGGMPDLRLLQVASLARCYRRALKRPNALTYGNERGEPSLRAALRELLRAQRGVLATDEEMIVTRGSQMALHLAARAICAPGDCIAVEALGYSPAWNGFRLAGAELAPIPLDRHGLRVDALARLAEARRVRAVYVTPHHQYPTTATMSAARRLELLALAERHRFFVIEDDYDHEFHWSGRPVLPLASADPARLVIYVGTLSKLLAPGLRVGYLLAREEVVERVARLRVAIDRQGDHVVERALGEWMEDGELDRHARKVRRAYAERRDLLATLLERELGSAVEFTLPSGGLAIWAKFKGPGGVDAFVRRARERGVLLQAGQHFTFDRRSLEALRIGFPALNPDELKRALKILSAVLKEAR